MACVGIRGARTQACKPFPPPCPTHACRILQNVTLGGKLGHPPCCDTHYGVLFPAAVQPASWGIRPAAKPQLHCSPAGTGKEDGDRHPKISDNVLIGASSRILGNIRIGRSAQVRHCSAGDDWLLATDGTRGGPLLRCRSSAQSGVGPHGPPGNRPLGPNSTATHCLAFSLQVAAGSTVLREVPPRTLVAGAPAREIGTITGNPALDMDQIQADTQVGRRRVQLQRVECKGLHGRQANKAAGSQVDVTAGPQTRLPRIPPPHLLCCAAD